jgi:hypothetical protein
LSTIDPTCDLGSNPGHRCGKPANNSLSYGTAIALKREELTEGWRKMHNEELHNLCSSGNRMIKSRRVRWAANVACMEVVIFIKITVGKF